MTTRTAIYVQTQHQATAEVVERVAQVSPDEAESWAEVAMIGPDATVREYTTDSFEAAVDQLVEQGFVRIAS